MDAEDIKLLRNAMNLNQQKFSDLIGVSWGCVSRWENGKFKPSPMALNMLHKLREETLERQKLKERNDAKV